MTATNHKSKIKKPLVRWVSFSHARAIHNGNGVFYKLTAKSGRAKDLASQLRLLGAVLGEDDASVSHVMLYLDAPSRGCPHVQRFEPQKGEPI